MLQELTPQQVIRRMNIFQLLFNEKWDLVIPSIIKAIFVSLNLSYFTRVIGPVLKAYILWDKGFPTIIRLPEPLDELPSFRLWSPIILPCSPIAVSLDSSSAFWFDDNSSTDNYCLRPHASTDSAAAHHHRCFSTSWSIPLVASYNILEGRGPILTLARRGKFWRHDSRDGLALF